MEIKLVGEQKKVPKQILLLQIERKQGLKMSVEWKDKLVNKRQFSCFRIQKKIPERKRC